MAAPIPPSYRILENLTDSGLRTFIHMQASENNTSEYVISSSADLPKHLYNITEKIYSEDGRSIIEIKETVEKLEAVANRVFTNKLKSTSETARPALVSHMNSLLGTNHSYEWFCTNSISMRAPLCLLRASQLTKLSIYKEFPRLIEKHALIEYEREMIKWNNAEQTYEKPKAPTGDNFGETHMFKNLKVFENAYHEFCVLDRNLIHRFERWVPNSDLLPDRILRAMPGYIDGMSYKDCYQTDFEFSVKAHTIGESLNSWVDAYGDSKVLDPIYYQVYKLHKERYDNWEISGREGDEPLKVEGDNFGEKHLLTDRDIFMKAVAIGLPEIYFSNLPVSELEIINNYLKLATNDSSLLALEITSNYIEDPIAGELSLRYHLLSDALKEQVKYQIWKIASEDLGAYIYEDDFGGKNLFKDLNRLSQALNFVMLRQEDPFQYYENPKVEEIRKKFLNAYLIQGIRKEDGVSDLKNKMNLLLEKLVQQSLKIEGGALILDRVLENIQFILKAEIYYIPFLFELDNEDSYLLTDLFELFESYGTPSDVSGKTPPIQKEIEVNLSEILEIKLLETLVSQNIIDSFIEFKNSLAKCMPETASKLDFIFYELQFAPKDIVQEKISSIVGNYLSCVTFKNWMPGIVFFDLVEEIYLETKNIKGIINSKHLRKSIEGMSDDLCTPNVHQNTLPLREYFEKISPEKITFLTGEFATEEEQIAMKEQQLQTLIRKIASLEEVPPGSSTEEINSFKKQKNYATHIAYLLGSSSYTEPASEGTPEVSRDLIASDAKTAIISTLAADLSSDLITDEKALETAFNQLIGKIDIFNISNLFNTYPVAKDGEEVLDGEIDPKGLTDDGKLYSIQGIRESFRNRINLINNFGGYSGSWHFSDEKKMRVYNKMQFQLKMLAVAACNGDIPKDTLIRAITNVAIGTYHCIDRDISELTEAYQTLVIQEIDMGAFKTLQDETEASLLQLRKGLATKVHQKQHPAPTIGEPFVDDFGARNVLVTVGDEVRLLAMTDYGIQRSFNKFDLDHYLEYQVTRDTTYNVILNHKRGLGINGLELGAFYDMTQNPDNWPTDKLKVIQDFDKLYTRDSIIEHMLEQINGKDGTPRSFNRGKVEDWFRDNRPSEYSAKIYEDASKPEPSEYMSLFLYEAKEKDEDGELVFDAEGKPMPDKDAYLMGGIDTSVDPISKNAVEYMLIKMEIINEA